MAETTCEQILCVFVYLCFSCILLYHKFTMADHDETEKVGLCLDNNNLIEQGYDDLNQIIEICMLFQT